MGIFLKANNEKSQANTTLKTSPQWQPRSPLSSHDDSLIIVKLVYPEGWLNVLLLKSLNHSHDSRAFEVLLVFQEKHWGGGVTFLFAHNSARKTEGNLGCVPIQSRRYQKYAIWGHRRYSTSSLNIEAYIANFMYPSLLHFMHSIIICILLQLPFLFF